MRWRLTALTVPLALAAFGFGSREGLSAPLVQQLGGERSLVRVDLLRPPNHPLKHCLTRKGARSCRGTAAAKGGAIAQAPHVPAYPGESTGPAAATGSLPLPNSPPPGRANVNRPADHPAGDSQAGNGPSPGFKFTGGMGVPTNRATLEGALSPYQQPNGNTAASQSGKLTTGLETQGMHFGLEWRY